MFTVRYVLTLYIKQITFHSSRANIGSLCEPNNRNAGKQRVLGLKMFRVPILTYVTSVDMPERYSDKQLGCFLHKSRPFSFLWPKFRKKQKRHSRMVQVRHADIHFNRSKNLRRCVSLQNASKLM